MKKLWVFIWRLNPPHNWHLAIIDKALSENDKVLILIWTKKDRDDKNPLNFEQIMEILSQKYNFKDRERIEIRNLPDFPTDEEWIIYLNMFLFEVYLNTSSCTPWFYKMNMYFGDMKNDSAYTVIQEYRNELSTHLVWSATHDYDIDFIEVTRKNSYIEYKWKKYEISSTNFRQALREKNYDLAKKFTDEKLFPKIQEFFEKL